MTTDADPTPEKKTRRPRLRRLHINKMIPNLLTLMAMSAGLTAIRFALQERWEFAAYAILIAAILDTLDGRMARILNGASKFGAELDSLSDFLSFGIAPAMMLYLWALQDMGRFGWALTLLYTVACALRLARFNTKLDEPDEPAWTRNFFSGVPSPAGAGLVLLPLILSFLVGEEFLRRPEVVGTALIVVGGLMVGSFPTYSFKQVKVPHKFVFPLMLGFAVMIAGLVTTPWITLSIILGSYLATFPFSLRAHARLKRQTSEEAVDAPSDNTD